MLLLALRVNRLKNIIEGINELKSLKAIVAFPIDTHEWYHTTMWNSMDILSESNSPIIKKCSSESVFEALHLLETTIDKDENNVLAPLGTRPHSLACAIFATRNDKIRVIHDYAIEHEIRTTGVEKIFIYHLSNFLVKK